MCPVRGPSAWSPCFGMGQRGNRENPITFWNSWSTNRKTATAKLLSKQIPQHEILILAPEFISQSTPSAPAVLRWRCFIRCSRWNVLITIWVC